VTRSISRPTKEISLPENSDASESIDIEYHRSVRKKRRRGYSVKEGKKSWALRKGEGRRGKELGGGFLE